MFQNPSNSGGAEDLAPVTLPSTATVEIFGQVSNNIIISSGAATITSFGTAPRVGKRVLVRFTSSLLIQTSNALIGFGANMATYGLTVYPGDVLEVVAETLTTSRILNYFGTSVQMHVGGVAFGDLADARSSGVAIGKRAIGTTTGTAVGYGANGSLNGVAVGYNASGGTSGAAVGNAANGGNSGAAIGVSSNGGTFGAAIGASANGQNYGAALGAYANTNSYSGAIAKGYRSACSRSSEEWRCVDGTTASPNLIGYGQVVLSGSTSNATPQELLIAAPSSRLNLLNNSALGFEARVLASQNSGGNCAFWVLKGLIKRGANAASTVLVGVIVEETVAKDSGFNALAAPDLTADATSGSLKVTVTGLAATAVTWTVDISYTERRY